MCCLMTALLCVAVCVVCCVLCVVGGMEIRGPVRAVPSDVRGVISCSSVCYAVHIPIKSANYMF